MKRKNKNLKNVYTRDYRRYFRRREDENIACFLSQLVGLGAFIVMENASPCIVGHSNQFDSTINSSGFRLTELIQMFLINRLDFLSILREGSINSYIADCTFLYTKYCQGSKITLVS